jgi:uncharacterized protein (DUF2336 family)
MEYEEAKRLASDPDPEVRRETAGREDLGPELIYFLSKDDVAAVRLAVAGNRNAPREADLLLARDPDDAVRARVGQKLGEGRPPDAKPLSAKKQALTVQVAETLATDNAEQVRQAIAEALKDSPDAPAHVVQQLARDIEIRVAGPILQNSPVLADGDLIDIMGSGPIKGVLKAIAKRRNVSQGVAEIVVNRAIASPDEASAVTDLLANDTARIGAGTMNKIIDVAPEHGDWHGPLASRKDLTSDNMRRVAEIPSEAIAETMSSRTDLDQAAMTALSNMIAKRMAELHKKRAEGAAPAKPANDEFLLSAMKSGKVAPICAALSLRAGISPEVTMRMLTSKNAKAVTALAWKAGMSMSQAQALQVNIGGIAQHKALGPTGTGGYPIAQPDMEWQIGLYVGS